MTFKYVVGEEFTQVWDGHDRAYLVESIERDAAVSCENNPLHIVNVVTVDTGQKFYVYATDAEVE